MNRRFLRPWVRRNVPPPRPPLSQALEPGAWCFTGVWCLVFGVLPLVLGACALAQTTPIYENDGQVIVPPYTAPNIDAVNFVNNGRFVINFTNIALPEFPPFSIIGPLPFETQNTLNYSNYFGKFMSCNSGFRFQDYNPGTGFRQRSSSFYNAGTINCGTIDTTNYLITSLGYFGPTNILVAGIPGSYLTIDATNVVSPGTINMGFESLLNIHGSSIDLSRGLISSELSGISVNSGANIGFNFDQGIFDGYWGIGDPVKQRPLFYANGINPDAFFGVPPPLTPIHPVTTRGGGVLLQQLGGTNFVSYWQIDSLDASGQDRLVRAVFLANTNAGLQANVIFNFTIPDIILEFVDTTGVNTNNLYVFDYLGMLENAGLAPLSLAINGFGANNTTFIPINYFVFENPPLGLGGGAAPNPIPAGLFNNSNVTNVWAAYQAIIQPISEVIGDVAGQDFTNLPGRIEIVADNYLNLSQTRIGALNFLNIRSTNHFAGSSRAQIFSPYSDVFLRSTNGMLAVTNLLVPTVPRPEGFMDLFSARWTNTVAGITNRYHVLFADIEASGTAPSRIRDLVLRSIDAPPGQDTVLVSDILHVVRSVLFDANRITITSNAPGSPTRTGGIIFESPDIIWSTSSPRLQYLTNNGFILTGNAVFFGGSRSSPYYSSNFNEAYYVFVNTGGITNFSSLIWATNFQNSGTFLANGGDIQLQQALTATLTNGSFLAPLGNISLAGGSLFISNHVLQAGAALSLSFSNRVSDGVPNSPTNVPGLPTNGLPTTLPIGAVVTNWNFWSASNGFSLFSKPPIGDLLGTSVTNGAVDFSQTLSRWAGEDRGCSPAGFSNNAALGRLILDGGTNSLFEFAAAGPANALYVDYLELKNWATTRDGSGNFIGIQIDPAMKIYFAQAVENGVTIAEKLNGKNGGGFCWVSNYAGNFSSTNIFRTNGTTYVMNKALKDSCDIDSNTNGIVNCQDPDPLPAAFGPDSLALTVALTNAPMHAARISWNTMPSASNFVYFKTSVAAANWQVLTNFVSGPAGGRTSVLDPMVSSGRLYRVRVDPQH